jgi:hypothetical protein
MQENLDNVDSLIVEGINSEGFGTIGKLVMRDKRLTRDAKSIYAYFRSFAGGGTSAFPKVETIMSDLDFKDLKTFYFHMNHLKGYGYVKVFKKAIKNSNGDMYERNIYILPEVPVEDKVYLEKMEEYKKKIKEKNNKKSQKQMPDVHNSKDATSNSLESPVIKTDKPSDHTDINKTIKDNPIWDKPIGDNPIVVNPNMDNSQVDNPIVDNPPILINNNSSNINSNLKSIPLFNKISQSVSQLNDGQVENRTDGQTVFQRTANDQEEREIREFNQILEQCQLYELEDSLYNIFEGVLEIMYFQKIKINNEPMPKSVVRNKLRKLNLDIINSAITKLQWNFNKGVEKVSHSTNYIITTLYNAIHEYQSDILTDPNINRMQRDYFVPDNKKI